MNDFSFLRLETTLSKALDTNPSRSASIPRFDQIQLLPTDIYLQVSNTKEGIAFDDNYSVYFVDLCGTVLNDVTSYIAINDVLINGVNQIEFEIAPIPLDYYKKEILLKFVHTISLKEWFTNPFVYTAYNSYQTTRFQYLTSDSELYQSINLNCYYRKPNQESTSKEYIKIDGQKVNSKVIMTQLENYYFDYCNGFTYRRLSKLLSEPIVYINGNRKTNRFTIESGDIIMDTDCFDLEFDIAVNYDETLNVGFQIFETFDAIEYLPSGEYTLSDLPETLFIQFNKDIVLGIGTLTLYKDDVLFHTFTELDCTIVGSTLTITDNLITANGSYYVLISDGLITSINGESLSVTEPETWAFTVTDGEFDSNDFTDEFLID